MWNPNSSAASEESRKDASVPDRNLTHSLSSSSSSASSEKSPQPGTLVGGGTVAGASSAGQKFIEQESQSCEVDSGFLSGPQLSGYDDSEYGIAGGNDVNSPKGSQDSQQSERPSLSKQITVVEAKPSILDSGLEVDLSEADIEEQSQQPSQPAKTTPMILDNKIDSGLTEWFCNLTLNNSDQPLNNLGCPDGQTAAVSSSGSSSGNASNANAPDNRNKQPWEIYYRQNDDGDT